MKRIPASFKNRQRPQRLSRDMRVREGHAAIAAPCADRFVAAAMLARSSDDADSLHRLRVSARRLRAALWIFRKHMPARERRHLCSELRWLFHQTGLVRDWDVFVEKALDAAATQQVRPGAVSGAEYAAAERVKARRQARSALASRRFSRLLSGLESFAAASRKRSRRSNTRRPPGEKARGNFPSVAGAALHKRHKQLRKLARATDSSNVRQLHHLRIQSKKLRYTAELLTGLYPKKPVRRYVAVLKQLQLELGTIHDLQVAYEFLIGFATHPVLRQAGDRLDDAVSRLQDPQQTLAALKPFWD